MAEVSGKRAVVAEGTSGSANVFAAVGDQLMTKVLLIEDDSETAEEITAERADRVIDLLPREFRLLEYMMQRSDQLLTRAMLLEEVWNYKFVPATNLVDVHMGRLRHKVDGPGEVPMIHNVRGAGFILRTGP